MSIFKHDEILSFVDNNLIQKEVNFSNSAFPVRFIFAVTKKEAICYIFKLGFSLCYSEMNICRHDEILPFVNNG